MLQHQQPGPVRNPKRSAPKGLGSILSQDELQANLLTRHNRLNMLESFWIENLCCGRAFRVAN